MRQFKWIEWNLQKIDTHGLSAEAVEAAFDHVFVVSASERTVPSRCSRRHPQAAAFG